MIRHILFIIIGLNFTISSAQNIDSLFQALSIANSDTTRAKILNRLSFDLAFDQTDTLTGSLLQFPIWVDEPGSDKELKQALFTQEAQIRDAEQEMRISVADANAKAVAGENDAKAHIAKVNADLKVKEADAFQLGETRKREADAAVREAQYHAEAKAAEALASKVEQEKRAELEAVARAEKAKQIVDAEAAAEQVRIDAEAEAQAIYLKLEAQARGEYEILAKKGEGLKEIVEGCGGSQAAFQLLMLEQLEHLSETAAKAISNIKFDKVVVWDGGGNGDGKNGTAGFLRNLAGSLPPMMNMMKDIGGVELPDYIGKIVEDLDTDKLAAATAGKTDGTTVAIPTDAPTKPSTPESKSRLGKPPKDGSSGERAGGSKS